MAERETLSDVLRQFAVTMATHYDATAVLHDLCDSADRLFGSCGAGVALLDDGSLRFVTASSDLAVAAEKAQEDANAGPCMSSIEAGHPLAIADVREHADQWPGFVDSVSEHGQAAVLAVPLILEDVRLGSMDIYDHAPREWSPADIEAATALGAIATAYLVNSRELEDSRRTAEQLQHALDSRVVIEQAKGVVAAQRGVSTADAFDMIRRHARGHNTKIRQVCERIIAHPDEDHDLSSAE